MLTQVWFNDHIPPDQYSSDQPVRTGHGIAKSGAPAQARNLHSTGHPRFGANVKNEEGMKARATNNPFRTN